MKLLELEDLPVECHQVTLLVYGDDDRGVSISLNATVAEDEIELEPDQQKDLWGEDETNVTK